MKHRSTCIMDGSPLIPLFSLGELYLSTFVKSNEDIGSYKSELELCMGRDSKLVQLSTLTDLEKMYSDYWYFSAVNESMIKELHEIVESIIFRLNNFKVQDNWIDIGCNDGTLLRKVIYYGGYAIGFDPIDECCNRARKMLPENQSTIINDYFRSELLNDKIKEKAKVITSIAMFYDLERPRLFVEDIYDILDDSGIWVIQMSYLPLMLYQMAFDNICHEHFAYYTLKTLKRIVEDRFKIVDCQVNDTNGGSFRIYLMKNDVPDNEQNFGTRQYRDCCKHRIDSMLAYEDILNIEDPTTFVEWFKKIERLKFETFEFIRTEKSKGKKIWGYGASTKGNTLLQYFGLDNSLIDGIAERQEKKWGLRTISTNIPIYSEDEMRKENPDYLLLLPWHFVGAFIRREQKYLNGGGKFIVPCPKFGIIDKTGRLYNE